MTRTRRGCGADADRAQPARPARLACAAARRRATIGSASTGGIAGLRIAVSADARLRRGRPRGAARCSTRPSVRWRSSGAERRGGRPAGRPVRAASSPRTWFPAAARLVEKLPAAARGRLDPGLRRRWPSRAHASAGRRSRTRARARRARRRDAAVPRRLRPAGHADAGAAGLRRRASSIRIPSGRARWIDWAGFSYPFNLTQQPAITCRRASPRRAAGRAADRGRQIRRGAGAARGAGLRGRVPAADAGRAARRSGRHGLTRAAGRMLGCGSCAPGRAQRPGALSCHGELGKCERL